MRSVQSVPLTGTGVDAMGKPFQERTTTLIINCHGCHYQSKHYVLKNMWVTFEVPHNEAGHEPRIVRDVAVKTMHLSEAGTGMSREELVSRFQTEARAAEKALAKSGEAHARPRRYLRVHLPAPLPAAIAGTHGGVARVRTISLGAAFLESGLRLAVGESVQMEIRSGLRKIQSTAVVRNVSSNGTGGEFVH